jgi:hypothetical protein
MIKKYANPHIVYFNSIIILENIIIPSTSVGMAGVVDKLMPLRSTATTDDDGWQRLQ